MQFCKFGINPSHYNSWRGLDPPELTFYNRTVVIIHADKPDLETDALRHPIQDHSSASEVLLLDTSTNADNLANATTSANKLSATSPTRQCITSPIARITFSNGNS
jgi:hypothetical protein